MIVYMGSSNSVCDLTGVAASLIEEGFSDEQVVWEIIEYCVRKPLKVATHST